MHDTSIFCFCSPGNTTTVTCSLEGSSRTVLMNEIQYNAALFMSDNVSEKEKMRFAFLPKHVLFVDPDDFDLSEMKSCSDPSTKIDFFGRQYPVLGTLTQNIYFEELPHPIKAEFQVVQSVCFQAYMSIDLLAKDEIYVDLDERTLHGPCDMQYHLKVVARSEDDSDKSDDESDDEELKKEDIKYLYCERPVTEDEETAVYDTESGIETLDFMAMYGMIQKTDAARIYFAGICRDVLIHVLHENGIEEDAVFEWSVIQGDKVSQRPLIEFDASGNMILTEERLGRMSDHTDAQYEDYDHGRYKGDFEVTDTGMKITIKFDKGEE